MRWNRQGLLWSTGSSLENRESTPEHRGHSSPLLGTRDIEQDPLCGQTVQPAETNPGPVLSVLDTSLPKHTNNPFVQDTNKGRFLAEHKEWIQRRDQLSCAHDMACLPPAPAAPGPHWPPLQHRAWLTCVFLKRKPPFFLQEGRGRLSGRWTRGQIHQRWLHGSCASTSQHILTQLVASPAPCIWHSAGTRCVLLWAPTAQKMPSPRPRDGPSHQLCSCCPLTIVAVPRARIRKLSMVGKTIPNGNQAQGAGAEPSPSRVRVSAPLWGH